MGKIKQALLRQEELKLRGELELLSSDPVNDMINYLLSNTNIPVEILQRKLNAVYQRGFQDGMSEVTTHARALQYHREKYQ